MAMSKESIEKTRQMILEEKERRKKMTPEELKAEDEALDKQLKPLMLEY